MKKTLFFAMLVVGTLCLAVSCKPKLKNMHALVRGLSLDDDTLKAMTVQYGENNDTLVFSLRDARFNNGIMIPNDSVIIDYIDGKNDTARALVVTILPRPIKNIDITKMKNAPLKTMPKSEVDKSAEENAKR